MEKIMRILLPFAMLISIANIAHAEVSDYLPAAKLKAEQFSQWNAGAGITQKLAHGNVEWVNPYGIAIRAKPFKEKTWDPNEKEETVIYIPWSNIAFVEL